MTRACFGPSPNTVCVPSVQRWQPRHVIAAARSFGNVGFGGMKSAAEPVETARFGEGRPVPGAEMRFVAARALRADGRSFRGISVPRAVGAVVLGKRVLRGRLLR